MLRSERIDAAALRRNTVPLAQLLGDPEPVSGPADRRRARRGRAPGQRGRRAARRRRHRAVHRPLPQGGDRRRSTTRSCARSRSGCATCASWRSAAPRSSSRSRAQGKLDDALEAQILGGRHQGPARGHLPAVQAEAAHQGADRPRGRPRAAGRRCCSATRRSTRRRAAAAFVDPTRASPTPPPRWTAPARSWSSGSPRTPTCIGELRERMWSPRPAASPRSARARRTTGAKFADYFDFAEPFAELPSHRILALFRGEKEDVLDLTLEPGEPTPRQPGRPLRAARSPRAFGIARPGPRRPTSGCRTPSAGPGAPGSWCTSASTCGCGCGRRPRTRRVRVFAANLRDLLLAAPAGTRADDGPRPGLPHRRQGRGRRRAPARSSPPTRSTRTSRTGSWDEAARHAGAAGRRSTTSS